MAELNGVRVEPEQLTALALVNYAHYTSMRVEDLRVRGLSLHLERLVQDCRRVFDAELDPDQLRCLIRHALAGAPRSVVVRVTVFDPDLDVGHTGADAVPRVLVTTRPAPSTPLAPLRLRSTRYRRELPSVKHVGLFGALRQRRIAQRSGFDDVLFTDGNGTISETATANIGLLDAEQIIWPQADCLAGVTMRLIDQARDARSVTAPVTLTQLASADAVFATNAVGGLRPVTAIDGIPLPVRHPRLATVSAQYRDIAPEPL